MYKGLLALSSLFLLTACDEGKTTTTETDPKGACS